jgi:hypothetical protein
MLASQGSLDNNENRKTIDRDKDHPFDPYSFAVMFEQFWEQVENGDTQAINGMEQHTKENKYLEDPVFVNGVYKNPAFSTQE